MTLSSVIMEMSLSTLPPVSLLSLSPSLPLFLSLSLSLSVCSELVPAYDSSTFVLANFR